MWRKLIVTPREINLDTVLFIGQVWRWKRNSGSFLGVIRSNVVELKQNSTEISYRVLNRDESPDMEKILNEYFITDISLEKLHEHFSSVDPLFKKLTPHFGGMRVLRQDPFECLLSFICSSNNNVLRITKMIDALCVKYGTSIGEYAGQTFYSFPTLEQLSRASEDDMRDLGFGYRAKYIVGTVNQLLKLGPNYLMDLRKKEDVLEDLTQFMGVGLKIAACVALYSLDKFALVPMDVHMIRAARLHYLDHSMVKMDTSGLEKGNLNDQKTLKFMTLFKEVFGEFAGWAQMAIYSSQLTTHDHLDVPTDLRAEIMGKTKSKKVKKEK